jgi:NAD(P) transhydrogenase
VQLILTDSLRIIEEKMSKKFDIIVIGSGPGGQRAAIQAAKLGRQVLVVEKDAVGGSCFHSGTIPSKTLREAVLREAHHKRPPEEIFKRAMDTKDQVLMQECRILENQLSRNHVEFLQGRARLTRKNSIEVLTPTGIVGGISFEKLILATGSKPNALPSWIPTDSRIVDSDGILNTSSMPKRLLVIGAGVIGCEYASIFSYMGVKVFLFDRRESLLRGLDHDIQEALKQAFKTTGMEFLLGDSAISIRATPKALIFDHGGDIHEFDAALVCLGRESLSSNMGLAELGVELTDRGVVKVNSHYQSSVANIYAVGDLVGAPGLAASAGEQGRLAALHACTGQNPEFSRFFPTGIYTIPEVSVVGRGEEDCRKDGEDFIVGKARFTELARGKIIGDESGYLKLMVSKKTRKILGVQILGTSASELVHLGQMAMALDGGLDFFLQNIFNYPTLAEAYKVAALNAHNQMESASKSVP